MFRKVHIVVISKQLIPESNNFFPETRKGGDLPIGMIELHWNVSLLKQGNKNIRD